MSWFKKVIKQFIKEDHEETDQFEAAEEKSEAPHVQNDWNNEWKKEVDSKIIYQYPKGKFRFPVISDDEIGISGRPARQENAAERRQSGSAYAKRQSPPEEEKQSTPAFTGRQTPPEENAFTAGRFEKPGERTLQGAANAGKQERPLERRQYGSAGKERSEFQQGRRKSAVSNRQEPAETKPSSDALHNRTKPREIPESSPKSYQSKMPFKPTEIPSPIYGYNRPAVQAKPKMEPKSVRPVMDSSDFLTSIMRRKEAEQAALRAQQKEEPIASSLLDKESLVRPNSGEETKAELTPEAIEKKAEHLLTEVTERNKAKEQEVIYAAETALLPEEKQQIESAATLELAEQPIPHEEQQEVSIAMQESKEAEAEMPFVVELIEETNLQVEAPDTLDARIQQVLEEEVIEAEITAVIENGEDPVMQAEEPYAVETEVQPVPEEEVVEAEITAVVEMAAKPVMQAEEPYTAESEIQSALEEDEVEAEITAVVEMAAKPVMQAEESYTAESEIQSALEEDEVEAEITAVVEMAAKPVMQAEEPYTAESEIQSALEEEVVEAEITAVVEMVEEPFMQAEESDTVATEVQTAPEEEAAVVEMAKESVVQVEPYTIESEVQSALEAEEVMEAEAVVTERAEEPVMEAEELSISNPVSEQLREANAIQPAEQTILLEMEKVASVPEEVEPVVLNAAENKDSNHSEAVGLDENSSSEQETAKHGQQEQEVGDKQANEADQAPPAKKKALPFNVLMLNTDRKSLENKRKQQPISKPVPQPEPVNDVAEEPVTEETAASLESVAVQEELPYYVFPEENLLNPPIFDVEHDGWIEEQTELLNHTFKNFNVHARVVNVTQGPSVTRYEVQPEPGVKVSKITNLSDDLKLSLAAKDIRIEAPIPGKHTIGIEVPNRTSRPVLLSEILNSNEFKESASPLTVALGLDISGKPIVTDLRKMPHGLIAGATGSGKSVCINTMLVSLLYKAKPEELKLLLIDPKMVELAPYNYIPHLASPVITDVKTATAALKWAVEEMERRYELLAHAGVRDITKFNQLAEEHKQYADKLPYIVIIIDELADLMMMAPADVEEAISRIAQKARACGIHLLIATQRPSVDVITGLIKANVPTRIAFSVSSQIDSRTVIDISGAEKLLGKGDMLFLENGTSKPVRLQGTFVSDEEIDQVVAHARRERKPEYLFEQEELLKKVQMSEEEDELFYEACEFVIEQGGASTSSLQRNFKIGYNRAARLIDMMEKHGYISEAKGTKPRDVLITEMEFLQLHDTEQH
ncbi:DNA translocase FtsK [Niallia taxi]|uniref:DNA translocase FtsK n=1 Tax=Niallia taxi TaxID=2499688 RepID=UPI003981A105